MKILFIFTNHSHLYESVFKCLSIFFRNSGHKTFVLINEDMFHGNIKKLCEKYFSGSKVIKSFKLEKSEKYGYFKRKLFHIKSINHEIFQIKNIFYKSRFDVAITSNSFHYFVNIITKFIPQIPIYYIQSSVLLSHLPSLSIRQRYENLISYLFNGIKLNRTAKYPPFQNKKINYVMWSSLWTDMISRGDFKIKYISRIMIKKRIELLNSGKKPIKKILVILNKRLNIGQNDWEVYSKFYIKFFKKNLKFEPTFKNHPSEDYEYTKSYFNQYNVVKEDIRIEDYDLILSHWSTFVFDSIAYEIPIILINPEKKFDFNKFRLSKFPIFASNQMELKECINKIDSGKLDFVALNKNFSDIALGENRNESISELYKLIAQ